MDRSKHMPQSPTKAVRRSFLGRTLLMVTAGPLLAVAGIASIGVWGVFGRSIDTVQRLVVPSDSPLRRGQWYWWVRANAPALETTERKIYDDHLGIPYYMKKIAGLGTVHVPYAGRQDADKPVKKLVLIHGFGGGNAMWTLNMKEFAKHYDVYAIDWIGAGRSDRPKFTAKTYEEADNFFVDPIEDWRKQMGLEEFVLIGHSMGAMLGTSYAKRHPERVKQLILASPAGVPTSPKLPEVSIFLKAIRQLWLCGLSPMSLTRFTGPFGPNFITWLMEKRFSITGEGNAIRSGALSPEAMAEYTYNNWGQSASAEHILNSHLHPGVIAKRSLTEEMTKDNWEVPTSFIYGGPRDWMDISHGIKLADTLKDSVYTDVRSVPDAGHQLFLDNPKGFNRAVIDAISEYETSGDEKNHDVLKSIDFI